MIWEGCDAQACYDLARSCAVLDQRDVAVKWLEDGIAAGWRDRSFLLKDEAMKGMLNSGLFNPDAIVPIETYDQAGKLGSVSPR